MSGPHLFSCLAEYGQNPLKRSTENFTTELLAHLFNLDLVFRRRFLKVVFPDQRMARVFRYAEATTQESLSRDCRVDLVLWANPRVHLIEVKIAACETRSSRWGQTGKPQVQRYISLGRGHVTYLTTSASSAPEMDQRGHNCRLVKHALFEELYEELRMARVGHLTKMFMEFMEDNGMSAPIPFKAKELRRAQEALEIIQKCQDSLAIVCAEVSTDFRSNLRTRSKLTRPYTAEWGVRCYLKGFEKGAVKDVGLSLEPDDDGMYFTVYLWGTLHPTVKKIRTHLGWDEWAGEHGCCSCIKLHGNRGDIPRMVTHAKSASRALGRAIRRFV